MLAAYGGAYEDPKLEAMLTRVVNRLVASSDRPDLSYKVTILNSPTVNAFALPTGQLYVTRGLLGLANDSSEVASVVSHEIAHVIAHHADRREEEARRAELVSNVVSRRAERSRGRRAGARALQARAGELLAGPGIRSRRHRRRHRARTPATIPTAPRGSSPRWAATPISAPAAAAATTACSISCRPTRRRPSASRARAPAPASLPRRAPANATSRAYLAAVDGLVYGEDPIDGFVRGRKFLHPKLGFTFTAPEGFSLDNTAQAVLGIKDAAGNEALRLDVVKVPPEQTLIEYLNSGWIENVEAGSVEELAINGFPAATATAKGDQWTFRLYAIRFGSEIYRFIFAAKTRTAETERAFREAVNTFRRLTLAEIRSAKPLRLKIVKVEPGDTVEHFASRMALIDRQLDRFRVLNGLDADDQLKPGEYVKIIVE